MLSDAKSQTRAPAPQRAAAVAMALFLSGAPAYAAAAGAGDETQARPQGFEQALPPGIPVPRLKSVPPKLAPAAGAPEVNKTGGHDLPPPSPAPEPAAQIKTPPASAPGPATEKYPRVAELEKLMFGYAGPTVPLEYRLDHLESAVFHLTYPHLPSDERIRQLDRTLLGTPAEPASKQSQPAPAEVIPGKEQGSQKLPDSAPTESSQSEQLPALVESADYQKQLPRDELEKFALELVNEERAQNGLAPLGWDNIAHRMGRELIEDLVKRNTVCHQNSQGENPDRRYTRAGGNDAVLESLVALGTPVKPVPNKVLVVKLLDMINSRQDDREALLSPHATDFAFSFNWSQDKQHIIACAEVVTKHAVIEPVPCQVSLGDRVDVRGVIAGPYKFQKITLAWEGLSPAPGSPEDEETSDEALPYFPPLDYEAHAQKSEHDWERGARLLQMGGIGLALAGGLFIPPVALAAPLIAASSSNVRPKAVSEIPVRGGVRVDGQSFAHKLPLSNNNKEGIYYITIWATTGGDAKPVAVSRRAIIVKAADKEPAEKAGLKEAKNDGSQGQGSGQEIDGRKEK